MDHNEAMRKFEHLMGRESDHAQETAVELATLIPVLPEKSRQLAEIQVKDSHTNAREFRELAQKVKEC
jgi:hypothetical protein